jgi:arylsulfatase A-like enzyme
MTSSAHGSERLREAQGYNVVLIVFDTLRKDALGCYEQTPTWDADVPAIHTPHLDAFAEVIDTPLLVRHPDRVRAGTTCDAWVQHHDIAATILDAAHVPPPEPIDGESFWGCLTNGALGTRDHVVVGWGSALTVIDQRWWLNCKVDGQGALLHDRTADGDSHAINLAEQKTDLVRELAALGVAEASRKGGIPDYLLDAAARVNDAPGCSPFADIPLRHP